jgi:HAD superfamily hydrolase (TIGR01549 family)
MKLSKRLKTLYYTIGKKGLPSVEGGRTRFVEEICGTVMIKAVICDLGDTLINFHHIDVFKAFLKGARETYSFLGTDLGLQLPSFSKYHRHQKWSIRWAYLKSKLTGREFNSLDTLKNCARKLNIPIPEEKVDELAWRWYEPLALLAKADPHAVEMLEELCERSLKLAIVSNTFVPPLALDRHLAQEKLLKYFPLRVYSCDLGVRKPKSKIFRYTLEKLEIQPHEAVFIGDSPTADILGARQVGMYAILKTKKSGRSKSDNRTYLVSSLLQVAPIIDDINHSGQ